MYRDNLSSCLGKVCALPCPPPAPPEWGWVCNPLFISHVFEKWAVKLVAIISRNEWNNLPVCWLHQYMTLRSLGLCPESLSDSWNDQGFSALQLKGPSLAKSTKSKRELLVHDWHQFIKILPCKFYLEIRWPKKWSCTFTLFTYWRKEKKKVVRTCQVWTSMILSECWIWILFLELNCVSLVGC